MSTSSSPAPQVDPRGPRFGASITAVLLLVTIALGLVQGPASPELSTRVSDVAFILLVILTALFAWGATAGITRHPYGLIFKALIRPRLAPPAYMEDAKPPTFAQFVGFLVSVTGVILHLVGVPYGLVIAAGAAFVASFLNAAFGLCLGCEMYALLVRWKIIR
jgi:hypothetical protein